MSEEFTSKCEDTKINKLKISCTDGCIMIKNALYRCGDIAADDTMELKHMCNNKAMCVYDAMKIRGMNPGELSCENNIIKVNAL